MTAASNQWVTCLKSTLNASLPAIRQKALNAGLKSLGLASNYPA